MDAATDSSTDASTDTALDAAPVDAGPLTGDTYVFVTDVLDMAAPDPAGDPAVTSGFNLDDRVSDTTDSLGCRKADRTAPPPDSFEGVDNELGPLLVSSESSFGFIANLHTVVRTGELLLLLRLRGVDDLVNDDRVELDLLFGQLPPGTLAPVRTAADRFEAGQSSTSRPRASTPRVEPWSCSRVRSSTAGCAARPATSRSPCPSWGARSRCR